MLWIKCKVPVFITVLVLKLVFLAHPTLTVFLTRTVVFNNKFESTLQSSPYARNAGRKAVNAPDLAIPAIISR